MQFKANSAEEFESTINSIISAKVYEEIAVIYALDICDGVINKEPEKYPVTVSLEFEAFEGCNRRYSFNACKFIYDSELLTGSAYQEKLAELKTLDDKLDVLLDQRDTSGTGFPLEEIAVLQKKIKVIETQLF